MLGLVEVAAVGGEDGGFLGDDGASSRAGETGKICLNEVVNKR